jgi:xanthine dehydrogenase YagR molybdenum-binding subunit
MKFDTPATTNPIDQMKVIGQGHHPYRRAAENHRACTLRLRTPHVVPNQAYGVVVGSAIAKGASPR